MSVLEIGSSVENFYKKGDRIGVLGLAYKTDTYLTTESQALQIADILSKRFGEVKTYDPMAKERTCNTKEEVIENSDIVSMKAVKKAIGLEKFTNFFRLTYWFYIWITFCIR